MPALNPIEHDLIDFLSQRRDADPEKITALYLELRGRFRFHSVYFRDFTEKIQVLHDLFFGVEEEKDLVQTYRHHSYLAILRFISYSYSTRVQLLPEFLYFLRLILRGEGKRAFCSMKRQLGKRRRNGREIDLFDYISEHYPSPVIVDYGCGLAYRSFRMGKEIPGAHIVLVDIDAVMNEFVEFRFRKHGISVETVKVTPECFYPELPAHQVCIADEVMEHLKDPLRVLSTITRSLQPGGILYGDYEDHCPEHFHLHTDMEFFRRELSRDFTQIGEKLYRKN